MGGTNNQRGFVLKKPFNTLRTPKSSDWNLANLILIKFLDILKISLFLQANSDVILCLENFFKFIWYKLLLLYQFIEVRVRLELYRLDPCVLKFTKEKTYHQNHEIKKEMNEKLLGEYMSSIHFYIWISKAN